MPLTTTPKTWIGNTDLTAADLNTHLRDQLLDLDRRVDRRIVGSRYAVTWTDVEDVTAETTFLSFPVAANDIADGDLLQLRWVATFAANQIYAGALTMRLRWGDSGRHRGIRDESAERLGPHHVFHDRCVSSGRESGLRGPEQRRRSQD